MARPLDGRKERDDMWDKIAVLDGADPIWRERKHANGAWLFSEDGTMLDENGNRSIFDDVDE